MSQCWSTQMGLLGCPGLAWPGPAAGTGRERAQGTTSSHSRREPSHETEPQPCLRQLKCPSFLYHPSSAQEPLNTSPSGEISRDGLREGLPFLKAYQRGLAKHKSPEADQAGLPTWNPGARRCRLARASPRSHERGVQGEVPEPGGRSSQWDPAPALGGLRHPSSIWLALPAARARCEPRCAQSSQTLLYTELNPRGGFNYPLH